MRAAVIQFEAGADKALNMRQAEFWAEAAMQGGRPGLISLPEMWSCLGGDRATKLRASEALPPPGGEAAADSAYAFLRDLARRLGVIVHGGSIGERAGDTLFNTSLVFDADGVERGRYRKIHLFDVTTPNGQGYRESALFGSGGAVVVADAGGLRLGLSVCYDVRFAELYLALRRDGAEVIFVPSAFTQETGRDHWEVLLRARAIETQSWVVAAATTGTHHDARGQARTTWGHSMIVDPWGMVCVRLREEAGVVSAELDMAALRRVREAMPVLDHRRLA